MKITLYTAPDCLRCSVVKGYLNDKKIDFEQFDFKADKDIFNAFYRANRPRIFRGEEGVEFPLFVDQDSDTLKQGSGEIIAYMLAQHDLECCVTRSDLLHGWISGLYVSQCPPSLDDRFLELIEYLAKGGLKIYLQTDGRRADLLEKVLKTGLITRTMLNIMGPASAYEALWGESPATEDLAKSIELVQGQPDSQIRLYLTPIPFADGERYITPLEAQEAARMVADACKNMKLPFLIYAAPPSGKDVQPLENNALLPYRSKVRNHLVMADIAKPEAL